jgi:hypothetical protein
MAKEKVYMVCDWYEGNVNVGALNVRVEFMGNCTGRLLREDGTEIGSHYSSSFGWLRSDLKSKLDNPSEYEIIDLIGQKVPERFKINRGYDITGSGTLRVSGEAIIKTDNGTKLTIAEKPIIEVAIDSEGDLQWKIPNPKYEQGFESHRWSDCHEWLYGTERMNELFQALGINHVKFVRRNHEQF